MTSDWPEPAEVATAPAPAEPPRRERPWRPARGNVRALDRWIRDNYGPDEGRYGTA